MHDASSRFARLALAIFVVEIAVMLALPSLGLGDSVWLPAFLDSLVVGVVSATLVVLWDRPLGSQTSRPRKLHRWASLAALLFACEFLIMVTVIPHLGLGGFPWLEALLDALMLTLLVGAVVIVLGQRGAARSAASISVARVLPVWLTILSTTAMVVGGALYSVLDSIEATERRALESESRVRVRQQALRIDQTILEATHAVALLRRLYESGAEPRSSGAAVRLMSAGYELARVQQVYGQIRILDHAGHETLRIDNPPDGPRIVPLSELQDKSGRDYFKETTHLGPGQLYASSLDLNVEHGVVERPFKPVLRLATRLHDDNHLVINLLATGFLPDAGHMTPGDPRGFMTLVDENGYWLRGENPEHEWGMMFADRARHRFDLRYPRVWERLDQDVQFATGDGLFTVRKISIPGTLPDRFDTPESERPSAVRSWYVIYRVPPAVVNGLGAEEKRGLIGLFALLLPLLAAVSWLVASGYVRSRESERRAIEELLQAKEAAEGAARAKADFLANMSHEIRTPMNGVLGLTELLDDTPLDAAQRELLGIIHGSARALMTIIDDILDFSKVEAGKLVLDPMDVNLEWLAREVLRLLQGRASEGNVELVLDYADRCPRDVIADGGRIRQVLTNLVGNAVKFTENGKVMVVVTGNRDADGDTNLRVEVRDSGIGIAEAEHAGLFDAFTQADTSTTRRFGGTGLGLAICRQLIELMDGRIGVDSTLGEGSTFWFELRLPGAAASSDTSTVEHESGALEALLVGERTASRDVLGTRLEGLGFAVVAADDSDRACALMRERIAGEALFSLVFLDLECDCVDDPAFTAVLREPSERPALVAVSSRGSAAAAGRIESGRFDAIVTAPIVVDELRDAAVSAMAADRRKAPSAAARSRIQRPGAAFGDGATFDGRVLLAEDNPVNRMVAETMLRKLGLEVLVASDGIETIDIWRQTPVDMILMDCHMPNLDGYEATRRIRTLESATGVRTPIVAVTANVLDEDRGSAIDSGMDAMLPKPYSSEQLAEVLREWLGEAKTASAASDAAA